VHRPVDVTGGVGRYQKAASSRVRNKKMEPNELTSDLANDLTKNPSSVSVPYAVAKEKNISKISVVKVKSNF
jgi:hypothetical protein